VYDPQLGRFLSADPVYGGDLAQPQTLNPYSYASNNPLTYRDPSGYSASSVAADGFFASTVDLIANGALLDLQVAIENYQRDFGNWLAGCRAALAYCNGADVPIPVGVGEAGRAAVRASTALMQMINQDLSAREQQRDLALEQWREEVVPAMKADREAVQSQRFWAFVDNLSFAAGTITITSRGLDPMAAREFYVQTLFNLRSEGAIPERASLWRDNFSFKASYGYTTSEGRHAGAPTYTAAWSLAMLNGGQVIGGFTIGNHSTIYRSAAHYSYIPSLGRDAVAPEATMRWIILHEYGHQLYGKGEEAADAFALRNFW